MSILQRVTTGDTSPARQIPDKPALCSETIERLRAARDARQHVIAKGFGKKSEQDLRKEYFEAVAAAAAELGLDLKIKTGPNTRAWNNAIAAIDEAYPNWRGYTVTIINPALLESAA